MCSTPAPAPTAWIGCRRKWLGHKPIAYKDVAGSGKSNVTFDLVDIDRATHYAAEDADMTLRLWMVLKPRLAAPRSSPPSTSALNGRCCQLTCYTSTRYNYVLLIHPINGPWHVFAALRIEHCRATRNDIYYAQGCPS